MTFYVLGLTDVQGLGPGEVLACVSGQQGFAPGIPEEVEAVIRDQPEHFAGPEWADVRRQLKL